MTTLPPPRGEISEALIASLARDAGDLRPRPLPATADPLGDEDLQLSLYLCYELHDRGLAGVDDRWEWEPSLLALRAALEARFEHGLREAIPYSDEAVDASEIDLALRKIQARADEQAPSVSTFLRVRANVEQML